MKQTIELSEFKFDRKVRFRFDGFTIEGIISPKGSNSETNTNDIPVIFSNNLKLRGSCIGARNPYPDTIKSKARNLHKSWSRGYYENGDEQIYDLEFIDESNDIININKVIL